MTKNELFDLVDHAGLLGLYRAGLFNPMTCEYHGTVFEFYWEHVGLAPTMGFRSGYWAKRLEAA